MFVTALLLLLLELLLFVLTTLTQEFDSLY